MATMSVLTSEHPILRRKAQKVKVFDRDLQRLADDMLETMRHAHGMGLAANQVGVLKQIVVIEMPEEDDDPQSGQIYTLVNPEIVRRDGAQVGEEGCLSVPGYVGQVRRAEQVTVRAQTLKGRRIRLESEGLLARVLQHEIDHLQGVLYVDHLERPEDLRTLPPEERWDLLDPEPADSQTS
ncbi:MAG: peptide deformylase [Chloroflexi bacterium]|nr:peptide deformylase [Chloroflexota bacterium]